MSLSRPAPRVVRTPRDAERAARDWMIYFGHRNARLTVVGPDMGVDVNADDAVAQVKAGASRIGRPVVQQIYGAAELESKDAYLFTVGGVTDEARQWANRAGVAVFRLDLAGDAFAVNAEARAVLDAADRIAAGWSEMRRLIDSVAKCKAPGAAMGRFDVGSSPVARWIIWFWGPDWIEITNAPTGSGVARVSSVDEAMLRFEQQFDAAGRVPNDFAVERFVGGRRLTEDRVDRHG